MFSDFLSSTRHVYFVQSFDFFSVRYFRKNEHAEEIQGIVPDLIWIGKSSQEQRHQCTFLLPAFHQSLQSPEVNTELPFPVPVG